MTRQLSCIHFYLDCKSPPKKKENRQLISQCIYNGWPTQARIKIRLKKIKYDKATWSLPLDWSASTIVNFTQNRPLYFLTSIYIPPFLLSSLHPFIIAGKLTFRESGGIKIYNKNGYKTSSSESSQRYFILSFLYQRIFSFDKSAKKMNCSEQKLDFKIYPFHGC